MIRKAIVSILTLIFINHLLFGVLIFSLNHTYFNKQFYLGAVSQRIQNLLVESINQKINPHALSKISQAEYQAIFRELFSTEFIAFSAASLLDQLKIFFVNQSIKLELLPIKNQTKALAEKTARLIISEMSVCDSNYKSAQSNKDCIPAGTKTDQIIADLSLEIQSNLNSSIPDEINLSPNPSFSSILTQISRIYADFSVVKILTISLGIFLLFLIAIIIFRPLNSVIAWQASVIFLSAISLFLTALSFDQLTFYATKINPSLPPAFADNMNFFSSFIIKDFYLTAALFFVASIVLYIISRLIKPYYLKRNL